MTRVAQWAQDKKGLQGVRGLHHYPSTLVTHPTDGVSTSMVKLMPVGGGGLGEAISGLVFRG